MKCYVTVAEKDTRVLLLSCDFCVHVMSDFTFRISRIALRFLKIVIRKSFRFSQIAFHK